MQTNARPAKKVALFGGSFNPPHPTHFAMGAYIARTLGVDEVWFLFSLNWQKDASAYASTADRMAMAELLKKHYPDAPLVMSDIEEELGTHITCDVLNGLQRKFPDHRFTWVMGADNLASFDSWENSEDIIQNHTIAILDRPKYTDKALASKTASAYAHLRKSKPSDLAGSKNGWCFLDNPRIDMASSDLLAELRAGKRIFDGPFQEVADYILAKGLYGMGKNTAQPEPHP